MAQADFTLVLDAAVKMLFPPELLAQADPSEVDGLILSAHDRAFEQARVMPVLWECLQGKIDGKKTQNKVYGALESARGEALKAAQPDFTGLEIPGSAIERAHKFIAEWVGITVSTVAKTHGGDPGNSLQEENVVKIFRHLIENNTVPTQLTRELLFEGQVLPQPYPGLEELVTEVFKPYQERARKKRGPIIKTEMCWYFFNGHCGYPERCLNAHDESELQPAIQMGMAVSTDTGKGGKSGGCDGGKGGGFDGGKGAGFDGGKGGGFDGGKGGGFDGGKGGGWDAGKGKSSGWDNGKGGGWDGGKGGKGKGKGWDSGKGGGWDNSQGSGWAPPQMQLSEVSPGIWLAEPMQSKGTGQVVMPPQAGKGQVVMPPGKGQKSEWPQQEQWDGQQQQSSW